jgi:hypothetical protein
MLEQCMLLKNHSHSLAQSAESRLWRQWARSQLEVAEADCTRGEWLKGGDRAKHCRLACSGESHESHDLAGRDREIYATENLLRSTGQLEALD